MSHMSAAWRCWPLMQVLGNIRVGEGAQIAAGSLVLKPVHPHTMVAGSPAKPVGRVSGAWDHTRKGGAGPAGLGAGGGAVYTRHAAAARGFNGLGFGWCHV